MWLITWFTENYVTHRKLSDSRGPCRIYVGILFFCEKLRESRKTTQIMENLKSHQKLVDNFLVERNHAKLWLYFQNIEINITAIYESYVLNWEINDFYMVPL